MLNYGGEIYEPLDLVSSKDFNFSKWKCEAGQVARRLEQFYWLCQRRGMLSDYSLPVFVLGDRKNICFSLADLFYADNKKNQIFFKRLAKDIEAIESCSQTLEFGKDPKSQELRLISGSFCRNRLCPLCSWRRRLKISARFLTKFHLFLDCHPDSKFIFLTLTSQSCKPSDLRLHISKMQLAYKKLVGVYGGKRDGKRDVLNQYNSFIKGSIRCFEITRSRSILMDRSEHRWGGLESCHPHIHALLAIEPTYEPLNFDSYILHNNLDCDLFSHRSTKKNWNPGWVSLWYYALRSSGLDQDSLPNLDIRYLGSSSDNRQNIMSTVFEVVKYIAKPLTTGDQRELFDRVDEINPILNSKYLAELSFQLYRKKLFESYGDLSSVSLSDSDNENLEHIEKLLRSGVYYQEKKYYSYMNFKDAPKGYYSRL